MNGVETLSEMTLREMQGDELTRDIFPLLIFILALVTVISEKYVLAIDE